MWEVSSRSRRRYTRALGVNGCTPVVTFITSVEREFTGIIVAKDVIKTGCGNIERKYIAFFDSSNLDSFSMEITGEHCGLEVNTTARILPQRSPEMLRDPILHLLLRCLGSVEIYHGYMEKWRLGESYCIIPRGFSREVIGLAQRLLGEARLAKSRSPPPPLRGGRRSLGEL